MMHGALALRLLGPSEERGFTASPAARLILQLEAHLHLLHLSEALAEAACCCDRVAMENLYPLGFLTAFTGSITEENVFAARKYKYYPEMLIFSLYDCFCPPMGAEVLHVQDRMGPGWTESEGTGLTTKCSRG